MVNPKLQQLWYVLHTKSRHEKVVNDLLLKKSVEAYLPIVTVRSKRRDRKAMIRVPLFPGYLFVKTDLHPKSHLEVVKTAGAVRLIGTKLQPTQPTLVAIWGIGTLKVNGVVPDGGENRLVHSMVTCHVRNNPDYSLAFDDDVDCSRFHTPLMLPPVQVVFDDISDEVTLPKFKPVS